MKKEEARDIMKVVQLIHFLDDETVSKEKKIEEIKYMRDTGEISNTDAINLVVEYFT